MQSSLRGAKRRDNPESRSGLPRRFAPRNDGGACIYPTPNLIPCASGNAWLQLIVFVCRRIYAFQESDPASLPPPVSFSPPNAPPISAPDVPILTFAIPQSLPRAERKASACWI